jgi:hypothetical protein
MPRKHKSKVNRSQAIRDYLAKTPKAGPSEIKESLAKNGIKVSDSLISAVKYKNPKSRRGKKRGRPARAASNGAAVAVDSLVAAKKMVDELGGIEAAEKAIGVLKRLG